MPCTAGNNEKSCFMWGSLSSRVQSQARLTGLVHAGNQRAVSSHGYGPHVPSLLICPGVEFGDRQSRWGTRALKVGQRAEVMALGGKLLALQVWRPEFHPRTHLFIVVCLFFVFESWAWWYVWPCISGLGKQRLMGQPNRSVPGHQRPQKSIR